MCGLERDFEEVVDHHVPDFDLIVRERVRVRPVVGVTCYVWGRSDGRAKEREFQQSIRNTRF